MKPWVDHVEVSLSQSMITPELLEYIRSQTAQGVAREAVREALVGQSGWRLEDVEEGFRIYEGGVPPQELNREKMTEQSPAGGAPKRSIPPVPLLAASCAALALAGALYFYFFS
jgi:hypothetical protein